MRTNMMTPQEGTTEGQVGWGELRQKMGNGRVTDLHSNSTLYSRQGSSSRETGRCPLSRLQDIISSQAQGSTLS